MTFPNDENLRKIIVEITTVLLNIIKTNDFSSASSLKSLTSQLRNELNHNKSEQFSYEFYQEAADLIENITQMRLDDGLREKFEKNNCDEICNDMVSIIKSFVYRHKIFTDIPAEKTSPFAPSDTLEAAHHKADAADAKAEAASQAAEAANKEALENLEAIKKEQQKTSGIISPELLNKSIAHTYAMYVKNIAAIIAADEAAAAIVNLKRLL